MTTACIADPRTPERVLTPKAFAVWFKDLERWSVGSFVALDWRWPRKMIRPLAEALTRKSDDVERKATAVVASKLITLHFDGEIEPRQQRGTKPIKGRLWWADAGDVVYSKIDVRNGAIGIVPDDLGRVCVTSEYPVYAVDPEVTDAGYIKLLFRTAAFRRKINGMISGASGRKRVQPSDLEALEVPLPPLAVQRGIVSAWERAQGEVADTRRRIAELEEQIEADFLADLGIDSGALQQRGQLLALPWSAIDRWGVGFNRWDWTVEDLLASRYPSRPLAEVATVNPLLGRKLSSDAKVSFVAMEAVDGESGRITEAIDRPYRDVRNGFTAFRDGDVIWAKITPCMQNGKCAVAENMTNGVGFGSTEFHVIRSHDVEALDTTFLWAILRLRRLREAAKRYFIGSAGQQRVPPDFLETLHIPLPPPPVQRQLVAKVAAQRKKIAAMKADAQQKTEQAKAEVEAIILGEKAVK